MHERQYRSHNNPPLQYDALHLARLVLLLVIHRKHLGQFLIRLHCQPCCTWSSAHRVCEVNLSKVRLIIWIYEDISVWQVSSLCGSDVSYTDLDCWWS